MKFTKTKLTAFHNYSVKFQARLTFDLLCINCFMKSRIEYKKKTLKVKPSFTRNEGFCFVMEKQVSFFNKCANYLKNIIFYFVSYSMESFLFN